MASDNGIQDWKSISQLSKTPEQSAEPIKDIPLKKKGLRQILSGLKAHKFNLGCMTLIWMATIFCYYLIQYQLKYLSGDIYVNTSLGAVSELIAYFASYYMRTKTSLKVVLTTSFFISSLGMILISYLNTENNVALSAFCILLSKFGVSAAVNMMYTANVQLFPISIIATTFGITNFFSRIFTILAPYVAELKPVMISQIFYYALNIMAFVATLFVRPNENTGGK